jgi:hypothetical protein
MPAMIDHINLPRFVTTKRPSRLDTLETGPAFIHDGRNLDVPFIAWTRPTLLHSEANT